MSVDKILEDRKRFVPKKGYNLIGIDEHELPHEAAYLIDHFVDEAAGKKALEARLEAVPHEKAFLLGPEGEDRPKDEAEGPEAEGPEEK